MSSRWFFQQYSMSTDFWLGRSRLTPRFSIIFFYLPLDFCFYKKWLFGTVILYYWYLKALLEKKKKGKCERAVGRKTVYGTKHRSMSPRVSFNGDLYKKMCPCTSMYNNYYPNHWESKYMKIFQSAFLFNV